MAVLTETALRCGRSAVAGMPIAQRGDVRQGGELSCGYLCPVGTADIRSGGTRGSIRPQEGKRRSLEPLFCLLSGSVETSKDGFSNSGAFQGGFGAAYCQCLGTLKRLHEAQSPQRLVLSHFGRAAHMVRRGNETHLEEPPLDGGPPLPDASICEGAIDRPRDED